MNHYYPPATEFDELAPWNRTETIEVHMCAAECGDCFNEVDSEGEVCKACLKYINEHQ